MLLASSRQQSGHVRASRGGREGGDTDDGLQVGPCDAVEVFIAHGEQLAVDGGEWEGGMGEIDLSGG